MGNINETNLTSEDFQHAVEELGTYIDVTVDDLMEIYQTAHKHAEIRQAEQVLVKDVMTVNVTSITADTSLRDAASILLEKRISGLPIVDNKNKLVGIVTEADFLTAMGIPSHHPAHNLWQTLESMFRYLPSSVEPPKTVNEIMQTNVISIGEDETLHKAIDTMKHHYVKRLIVTDIENCVIGILTRSNLIKVLLEKIL